MPEWLLKKDDYSPEKGNNAFINKSIISLLTILNKFRVQADNKQSKFKLNAAIKLISTLILIIFTSLSKNTYYIFIVDVVLLIIINFLSIKDIKHILNVNLIVLLFTFIVLLPAIFIGYGNNSAVIILKVLTSITSANILAITTNWSDLINALKLFHMPDIFIFVLDITIKYIIILGEFSLNMLYALKVRSVGRSDKKSKALSGIVGTMFIKSKEMAEDMHMAMECRGFTGEYKIYTKFKFSLYDFIFVAIDLTLVLIYFYFDRL
ncbi:energy-coupling factor transporter transmembrane component T [Clostridium sp. C8-1-8]|uniref:energy-coupling factor transporter transmembrane component T family protein n=1 Tax=Clostridium sp. C8-1-8 TaxID=2698831 RepID=UPI00136F936D|nr:energy-coupling factor transporter transmembrane component T [Clostridium sp. C8-1-8]